MFLFLGTAQGAFQSCSGAKGGEIDLGRVSLRSFGRVWGYQHPLKIASRGGDTMETLVKLGVLGPSLTAFSKVLVGIPLIYVKGIPPFKNRADGLLEVWKAFESI